MTHPQWTTTELVEATEGTLLQTGTRSHHVGVFTDSRRPLAGGVFVPLRGERFDGHGYIPEVLESGASALVIERDRWSEWKDAVAPEVTVLGVADTLKGLGNLGRFVRQRWGKPVLGITGSAGKTTCKQLLRAVLAPLGPVHATPGNWNNRIGVPLTLFGLGDSNIAVVEMGTSEPGEIEELARIGEPDLGWITNVGAAHLEGLGSVDGVAREKGALFRGVRTGGTLVVNLDDPRCVAQAAHWSGNLWTYGHAMDARVRVVRVETPSPGNLMVALEYEGSEAQLELPGMGTHMGLNVAGALCSAMAMGVSWEEALKALSTFEPPPQRMNVRNMAGVNVLDDCYNANPLSMRAALHSFGTFPNSGKRLAVLGDMLELGEASASFHAEIGELAVALGLEGLVAVGNFGEDVVRGARAAGATFPLWAVPDASAATPLVKKLVKRGDWVLVKGSRGVKLETVIAGLEGGGD